MPVSMCFYECMNALPRLSVSSFLTAEDCSSGCWCWLCFSPEDLVAL